MEKNSVRKKQVGIITLSGSDNCGSLLQAYALQEIIKQRYDYNVEIIDYKDKVQAKIYNVLNKNLLARPKQLYSTIKSYKQLCSQRDEYQYFRDNYLNMTKNKYQKLSDLKKEKFNYDIVVSGSDQVWNIPEPYVDSTYVQSWVNDSTRKIAYAASTGGTIKFHNTLQKWFDHDSEQLQKYHKLFKRYDMISIREETGKNYFSRLLGYDIPLVADPTLILSKEHWNSLVNERIVDGEYIFFYSFGYRNKEINKMVSYAAKKLGLPVYVINASQWANQDKKQYNFNVCNNGGPLAYLSLMKYAKYVFAESFHGCIFATIFNKNFWFLNNNNDGKLEARINSLLTYLELKNRNLYYNILNDVDLEQNIDYSIESPKIISLKQKSLEFMNKCMLSDEKMEFPNESYEYKISKLTNWEDMSDTQIIQNYKKLRDMDVSNLIEDDTLFYNYLLMDKEEFSNMSPEEFLNNVLNNERIKNLRQYKNITKRYGTTGRLTYKAIQLIKKGKIKDLFKALVRKYKWWFKAGY